ncbi:MAG TPA: response regulator [Candidatus Dormibacteraeota bacterium]|nr:response regulator [Candidatus Dormibacteraeota bacterium]
MSETQPLASASAPMIYFIDDSATMREVIKIAFRKEHIQVTACPNAASAIEQFETAAPDIVITDVIMPDKDGYEVCQFVKQHDQFGRTPVILMSGVVNKSVAEKAMAVKADELIRKPFQPQELIARVKNLLNPRTAPAGNGRTSESPAPARESAQVLSTLFGANPTLATPRQSVLQSSTTMPAAPAARPAIARTAEAPAAVSTAASAELQKLRAEMNRLELLVKKLRAELQAEHEYCEALESQLKTMQET